MAVTRKELNPLILSLCEEKYVQDVLQIMREKEESEIYTRSFDADELTSLWRRMLVEWMFFVVDTCKLERRAVGSAAFFLDVAMSQGLIETREEHQLAAATALQLALKTCDTTVIKIDKLVRLGRGLFTESDVARMEWKIITTLKFHLHPPSTYCFQSQYLQLLPDSVDKATRNLIEKVTKVISELTVKDSRYNRFPPSQLGYATILLAMELIDTVDLSVVQRQCFVLRMRNYAKIDSGSRILLKIFDELRGTLDASSKLPELLDSLALARKETSLSSSGKVSESGSNSPRQSPRHVMARLTSNLFSSSQAGATE